MGKNYPVNFRGWCEIALIQNLKFAIPKPFYGQPLDRVCCRLSIKELGMADPDYQVGTHFEALDKCALMAGLKSSGNFSPFEFSLKYDGKDTDA